MVVQTSVRGEQMGKRITILLISVGLLVLTSTGAVLAFHYDGEQYCADHPAWPNGSWLGQFHPWHQQHYINVFGLEAACPNWASDQRKSAISGLRQLRYSVIEPGGVQQSHPTTQTFSVCDWQEDARDRVLETLDLEFFECDSLTQSNLDGIAHLVAAPSTNGTTSRTASPIVLSGSGQATQRITLAAGLWIATADVGPPIRNSQAFQVFLNAIDGSDRAFVFNEFLTTRWQGETTVAIGQSWPADIAPGELIVEIGADSAWTVTLTKQ